LNLLQSKINGFLDGGGEVVRINSSHHLHKVHDILFCSELAWYVNIEVNIYPRDKVFNAREIKCRAVIDFYVKKSKILSHWLREKR
jgi:hypothetical protein